MVIELSPIRVINKLRGSLIWFSLYNQELQSQTKIVGALRPNAVFFLLVLPLSLSKLFIAVQSPNLVHQHWGDKETQKCPNNFEWDCSLIPDQTVRLEVLLTISKSLLWQNLWYFELFQKQKATKKEILRLLLARSEKCARNEASCLITFHLH